MLKTCLKSIAFFLAAIFCATPLAAKDLPTIKLGYIFTTNHTPLIVALAQGEEYSAGGYSLAPIIPKEKYEFKKNGEAIAILDIVVAKSGSEVSTLFAQKHLDISLASITAIISGVDKDVPMKIVAPVVLVSGGMVVPAKSDISDWKSFIEAIKNSKEAFKIGYHSPTSAPLIITESALLSEDLKISRNPNDAEAQVIMVDLKETGNMLPALASGQVEAVVGPAPFPQNAVLKNTGKFITELRDMPPAGKWSNYPCCVVAAGFEMMDKRPELVTDFVKFITASSAWCNENNEKAGQIAAGWLGLSPEVDRTLNQRFVTEFSDGWKDAAAGYMEVLNQAGYFKNLLKDKSFKDIESRLMDESFISR